MGKGTGVGITSSNGARFPFVTSRPGYLTPRHPKESNEPPEGTRTPPRNPSITH